MEQGSHCCIFAVRGKLLKSPPFHNKDVTTQLPRGIVNN